MKISFFPPGRLPHLSIFFNVDSSVGRNGANSSTGDILLVQYLMKKVGELQSFSSPEGLQDQQVLRNVQTTGIVDQRTIAGIEAGQRNMKRSNPGTAVDGRVSPARSYDYVTGFYTIVSLNGSMRKHAPKVWPRLQDFPDCPPLLKIEFMKIL